MKMFASPWEASDYAFMFAHPDWSDDPTHVVGFLVPTRQEGHGPSPTSGTRAAT
jgi:hypothetical protein